MWMNEAGEPTAPASVFLRPGGTRAKSELRSRSYGFLFSVSDGAVFNALECRVGGVRRGELQLRRAEVYLPATRGRAGCLLRRK